MDEAELAVVVARLNLVEHGGVDLGTQWLSWGFGHHEFKSLITATDPEFDRGLIGQDLPADDISWYFACDREDLIAGSKPGPGGCGIGLDGHHLRSAHPHTLPLRCDPPTATGCFP